MENLFIVNGDGEIVRSIDPTKERLTVRTKEQDKAFYELQKRRSEGRSKSFTFTHMGNVYEVIQSLSTAQCGLLLVLITFIDYDGVLRNPDKTAMTKNDIRKVLKLEGKRSFYDFMKVSLEAGILIEVDDQFTVNSRYHFKGNSRSKELVRVLATQVRELHKENKLTDIGILYKIQAHVHVTRNVLVKNPNETDEDKIEFLNREELAGILGISTEQVRKVIGRLRVDGQLVVASMRLGRDNHFVVNPDVFNRATHDETLRTLFRSKNNRGGK